MGKQEIIIIMMRILTSLSFSSAAILLVAFGGGQLVQACQHHGHDKQWTITPEELAEIRELERKWGTDVSLFFLSLFTFTMNLNILACMALSLARPGHK